MQFFLSFYEGQLKQQICYSFILLISHMAFNPFKMVASNFPKFDGPNASSPNSTGPWPQLQKGWKIPEQTERVNVLDITFQT